MESERKHDEFRGERAAPPGKDECLRWCARLAKGVLTVVEECRMKLRGTNPGQRAPTGIGKRTSCGALPKGEGRQRVRNEIEALLIEVKEGIGERPSRRMSADKKDSMVRQQGLRTADYTGGAPWGGQGGGMKQPHHVWLMSAMASAVMQSITVEGQNLPRYSSWENLTVTLFPVAYSDSAQWIPAATSTNVCIVGGWKNCDVVSCRPKLLVVKKNRW